MNVNNLAQKVNIIVGSPDLDLLPFFVQSFSLPGISFGLPEAGGRVGVKNLFASDTISYNDISFSVLIDEDFKVYFEFMDKVFKSLNVEKSTFSNDVTFNLFMVMTNNKGTPIFKYDIYNCRIQSVGDVEINLSDESVTNTFDVGIKFEYYKRTTDQSELREFLTKIKDPRSVEQ